MHSHRYDEPPSRRRAPWAIAALSALTLVVGASFVFRPSPVDPAAIAPVDLNAPMGMSPADLQQWCLDREAQGTAGLSANAVTWLQGCAEAFAPTAGPTPTSSATPTPTPTGTPTSSPTATPSPTGSPSPTPTPTQTAAGPVTGCAAHPKVCGYPDASTTGVPAGTALTVHQGDLTIKTAGTVIDALDIKGCVFIQADNVTIKRSKVTCRLNYGIRGFANGHDYAGIQLQDDEIDCGNTNTTGVAYSRFVALRLNVHNCENGFAISDLSTVQDSFVHDLFTGNGAHTDGAQLTEDAGTITFEHNTFLAPQPQNSAIIMYTPSGDQNYNVLIENNLLAGGGWTLYCPRTNTTGNKVLDNRFGPSAFGPTDSCVPGHVAAFSGNVNDTTGAKL